MNEKVSSTRKQYLGDGVYADVSGYRIVLTTEDGERITNTIYLELETLEALLKYNYRMQKAGEL